MKHTKPTTDALDYWGIAESLAEQWNVYFPASSDDFITADYVYPFITNPDVIDDEDLRYCLEDDFGRGFLLGLITEHIRQVYGAEVESP